MIAARRATLALLSLLSVSATACHRSRSAPLASDVHTRVYTSVVRDLVAQQRDSTTPVVVLDRLLPGQIADDQVGYLGDRLQVDRALVRRFVASQQPSDARLSPAAVAHARVRTVTLTTLDSLRRTAQADAALQRGSRVELFWRHWSAAYPGANGYITLSPVTVSDDGRDALVYVTLACGALCGSGEVRHLRREDSGAWRQAGAVELWVS